MAAIYDLMNKGEQNLTDKEANGLRSMALEAERYEDEVMRLVPQKQPETLTEMVELKMYQLKLTQAELADKLGISRPKLSQILSGKRRPDLAFLKAVHKVLHVDAAFLLEKA